MSENTIDLFSYMKQSEGITETTIKSLAVYGFDSNNSVMALDINKDLPKMTAINIGQRALLRKVIKDYKLIKSDCNEMSDYDEEVVDCNENRCRNNQTVIDKMKDILHFTNNSKITNLKDSLNKNRLILGRTKHEVTKLKTENMQKDVEIKRLNSENFRLRNRSTDSYTKQLENTLKEREFDIKRLLEVIDREKRINAENIEKFNNYHKNCLNDLTKLKTYMTNESHVVHRLVLSDCEKLAPNDNIRELPIETVPKQPILETVAEPPTLQTDPEPNSIEDQQNCEPNNSNLNEESAEPPTQALHEEDKQPPEEQISKKVDNISEDNYLSFDDSMISMDETEELSETTFGTSSQVVRVSKEISFQYLNTFEGNANDDHNYSVSESTPSKTTAKIRSKRLEEKKRSGSQSEDIKKDENKRISNSMTNVYKKQKTEEKEAELPKEDNKSTHLVISTELEKSVRREEERKINRNSVTLSSITGSKLISIDINGESDGSATDTNTNSLSLRQNVISNEKVSQIATSNGYLSDSNGNSNEENRCSIVNSVAPLTSTPMITRRSSADSITQPEKKGFKCTLPECDFVTLFPAVFDDHINNHVTYHFGQEIPDYWRPNFEYYIAHKKNN